MKWHGEGYRKHARTSKEPSSGIPTFAQTIELLMKVSGALDHPPVGSSELMAIRSAREPSLKVQRRCKGAKRSPLVVSASCTGSSRLMVIGKPHWPSDPARPLASEVLPHAEKILPYCKRSHIGVSLTLAKKYFWNSCEVFSMSFASLAIPPGKRYISFRILESLLCFHVSELALVHRFRNS